MIVLHCRDGVVRVQVNSTPRRAAHGERIMAGSAHVKAEGEKKSTNPHESTRRGSKRGADSGG